MGLRIALDAGHGLYTAGKRVPAYLDDNCTREWQLNDRICDILEENLKYYDCEVLRVDDTSGHVDVSLASRVYSANKFNADVYLSIHHNAGIAGGTGGGTVVFYANNSLERRGQAQYLYDKVVDETGLVGNRSQKVVYKTYYVITHTKCPAFLLENGFMDSRTDINIILSEDHAHKTVNGIMLWLINCWRLEKKKA